MITATECLVGTRHCVKYYTNIISFNITNNLMRYFHYLYLIAKNFETKNVLSLEQRSQDLNPSLSDFKILFLQCLAHYRKCSKDTAHIFVGYQGVCVDGVWITSVSNILQSRTLKKEKSKEQELRPREAVGTGRNSYQEWLRGER